MNTPSILLKRQGRCLSIGPTYKSLKKWMWSMRGVSCHQMLCKHNNWYFLCKYVRQEKERYSDGTHIEVLFFLLKNQRPHRNQTVELEIPLYLPFFFLSKLLIRSKKKDGKEQIGPSTVYWDLMQPLNKTTKRKWKMGAKSYLAWTEAELSHY